mmetsp:Transcript_37352/g.74865  ORF Transcript_37352/g.74865 Transcript_37352/m.74865 type:complete len:154 (+) Transcript_37352:29-490(+)
MSQMNYALAGAATVAVGVLAYYLLKPKGKKVPLKSVELTVESKHIDFLKEMIAKYKIKDLEKAMRIVVQFAMSDGDKDLIYKTTRCNTCGGKKAKTGLKTKLYLPQYQHLEEMMASYKIKDINKTARVLLEYCQVDGNQDVIFSTTRCKTCGP